MGVTLSGSKFIDEFLLVYALFSEEEEEDRLYTVLQAAQVVGRASLMHEYRHMAQLLAHANSIILQDRVKYLVSKPESYPDAIS